MMSEIRLYVDEDAAEHAVVQGLRARGVDVLTTAEADRLGSSDEEQLAFAIAQHRTIYTFNVGDFARLHTDYLDQELDHTGIILIPDQRYSIGEKIKRFRRMTNKQVEIYEYIDDAERYIRNALKPAKVKEIRLVDRVGGDRIAMVNVESKDKGIAIGRNGQNIKKIRFLAQRYFGLDTIVIN